MLLNDMPAVHQVDQAMVAKPKVIETILLGDLNACLEEPRDEREEDLTTPLVDHGLEDVRRNFNPHRRYRGWYRCTWDIHR